jgi:calcineurin-like phosphoesterase family protein
MANEYKIWFTSDIHKHHKNIIKFQKERCEIMGITEDMTDDEKLKKHDEWVIKMWNMTVGKHDHVYILGDFSFDTPEETAKFLGKLNGKKHLIIGNHDKSCKGLENYFVSVSQIKEFPIKKHQYDFLEENIYLVLCHFPMVAWNRRLHGAIHLHGHTHGSIDLINKESGELRVDIGLDSEIANYGLVSLESIYNFMKDKIKEKEFTNFEKYIENKSIEDGVRY